MDIFLEKRAIKQIRVAATDAIEEGETDSLREEIASVFTDDQIEEIERRIDTADFFDFLTEILDEWSCEDIDELFELLEGQLADGGVDLKYTAQDLDEDDEDDDDDDDLDGDEEFAELDEDSM